MTSLNYQINIFKSLIITILFLFISCKKNRLKSNNIIEEKHLASLVEKDSFIDLFKKISKAKLPFTNDSLNRYIVFNEKYEYEASGNKTSLMHDKLPIFENVLKLISKKQTIAYKPSKTSEYLKGNYFYPINKFSRDSVFFITFLYQDFEDIVPSVKTQINSYDRAGNILDTLLLDNRFSFQLIYKNDFVINKDYTIKITENVISYFDKMDNLIPKGTEPIITKNTQLYSIKTNGKFEILK